MVDMAFWKYIKRWKIYSSQNRLKKNDRTDAGGSEESGMTLRKTAAEVLRDCEMRLRIDGVATIDAELNDS